MSLVFQNDGLNGPRTHAFIVGVSDYAHLPEPGVVGDVEHLNLKKLSSPALSAWRVYQWLLANQTDLTRPLASVRLLIAPSPAELAAEPLLAGPFTRPTWDDFARQAKAWRKEACSDPGSVTFFYFSGHGAQFRRDNLVMLMGDFGDGGGGILNNAVELNNLVTGMAPAAPPADMIARTQLYFIDACRSDELAESAKLEQVPSVFTEVSGPDDRNRPVLFATVDGQVAIGRKGKVSHFCEALINAFETACDFARDGDTGIVWPVTVDSVRYSLEAQFIARELSQKPFLQGGAASDIDIRFLRQPPNYEVTVKVDPPGSIGTTTVQILDETDQPLAEFPAPDMAHPYKKSLPMGVYDIVATDPPHRKKKSIALNQRQSPVRILMA
jgi:Caspase domain